MDISIEQKLSIGKVGTLVIDGSPRFETTHWSLVLAAGGESSKAKDALAELCQNYWLPLYAFIRRWGHDPEAAADLTQGFFATLLQREDLKTVDPAKGRFRTFLLACCRNFLCNDRRKSMVRGHPPISIDAQIAEQRYGVEPLETLTPEQIYDRRWALSVLERALATLREDYTRSGRSEVFEQLKPTLTGEPLPGGHAAVAKILEMNEGAVQVAAHRLRRRYREAILALIAQTVDDPADIDAELRDLFAAVASP